MSLSVAASLFGLPGVLSVDRSALIWNSNATSTSVATAAGATRSVSMPFANMAKIFSAPRNFKLKIVGGGPGSGSTSRNYEFEFESARVRDDVKDAAAANLRVALGERADRLRAAVLSKQPALLRAYNETVLSGVISPDDFWSTRSHLLQEEEARLQEAGRSSAMPDLPRMLNTATADDGEIGSNMKHIQLTKDVFEFVMQKYPIVRQKYCEFVLDVTNKSRITEAEFFQRFFETWHFRNGARSSHTLTGGDPATVARSLANINNPTEFFKSIRTAPAAAIERPLRHESGDKSMLDATDGAIVVDSLLDASMAPLRKSGNVHGVSAHAGYGTADVPRLYELDDDTSKATGDIHGLKLAAFLSQCNDFSMSVVEDSMVGKSDTDAPTFAAPGPLTKTVELPITADDYFKMASASVSDSNATDVDKKPAIKRSRVDPAGGEQEVPSFHDCAVQQLSECEAKDGYGVPASLRIMTDLLQPASRAASALAMSNLATLDRVPPDWKLFVVHTVTLSNELIRQLWRHSADGSSPDMVRVLCGRLESLLAEVDAKRDLGPSERYLKPLLNSISVPIRRGLDVFAPAAASSVNQTPATTAATVMGVKPEPKVYVNATEAPPEVPSITMKRVRKK